MFVFKKQGSTIFHSSDHLDPNRCNLSLRIILVDVVTAEIRLSGVLDETSTTFNSDDYPDDLHYYDAYIVMPQVSADHEFYSTSDLDTYGYLYRDSFNQTQRRRNLQTEDNDSGGNSQFLFTFWLEASTSYIVIVSTYSAWETGAYTLTMSGPDSTTMTRLDECKSFAQTPEGRVLD